RARLEVGVAERAAVRDLLATVVQVIAPRVLLDARVREREHVLDRDRVGDAEPRRQRPDSWNALAGGWTHGVRPGAEPLGAQATVQHQALGDPAKLAVAVQPWNPRVVGAE